MSLYSETELERIHKEQELKRQRWILKNMRYQQNALSNTQQNSMEPEMPLNLNTKETPPRPHINETGQRNTTHNVNYIHTSDYSSQINPARHKLPVTAPENEQYSLMMDIYDAITPPLPEHRIDDTNNDMLEQTTKQYIITEEEYLEYMRLKEFYINVTETREVEKQKEYKERINSLLELILYEHVPEQSHRQKVKKTVDVQTQTETAKKQPRQEKMDATHKRNIQVPNAVPIQTYNNNYAPVLFQNIQQNQESYPNNYRQVDLQQAEYNRRKWTQNVQRLSEYRRPHPFRYDQEPIQPVHMHHMVRPVLPQTQELPEHYRYDQFHGPKINHQPQNYQQQMYNIHNTPYNPDA